MKKMIDMVQMDDGRFTPKPIELDVTGRPRRDYMLTKSVFADAANFTQKGEAKAIEPTASRILTHRPS